MKIQMPDGKTYKANPDRTMDVVIAATKVGLWGYRRETWRRIKPRLDVLAVYDRLLAKKG